ncbi:hypothetical protein [Paraburkholderia dinghuensis]|uniref:Cytochrome c oxidase subunit 2A n=1 Tax=Paraburkholderia dinghuensis TaxID=2305225 RepID=A0A3N6MW45_9BURK|nr:hypothetical protein [Paraburkholderia dinghuensis]RQH02221.1 hypothetical protein D1Y85_22350 [Paraburkholderia dinghuensis]
MIETPAPETPGDRPLAERVDEIVQHGPGGALALATVSTAIVTIIWFAFYFLVFLPRGVIQ